MIDKYIPIIADYTIKKEFGTGLVKITPSSDFNDYNIGLRHALSHIKIIDEKGMMCNTNLYDGIYKLKVRKQIINKLLELNLLEKHTSYQTHQHQCYRCDTEIEPIYLHNGFSKCNR